MFVSRLFFNAYNLAESNFELFTISTWRSPFPVCQENRPSSCVSRYVRLLQTLVMYLNLRMCQRNVLILKLEIDFEAKYLNNLLIFVHEKGSSSETATVVRVFSTCQACSTEGNRLKTWPWPHCSYCIFALLINLYS